AALDGAAFLALLARLILLLLLFGLLGLVRLLALLLLLTLLSACGFALPGVLGRLLLLLARRLTLLAARDAGRLPGGRLAFFLDRLPVGVHHVPLATESLDTLTVGVAGVLVAHEGVERPAAVADLHGSVRPLHGPDQRGVDPLVGLR